MTKATEGTWKHEEMTLCSSSWKSCTHRFWLSKAFCLWKMVIPLGRWAGLAMSAKISVTTQRVGVICILFLLWKISEARCTSQTCYMKRECVWNHTIWCSLHVSVHPSFLTAGTAVRAAQEMTKDEGSQAFKRMPPTPNAKWSPKKLELASDLEPGGKVAEIDVRVESALTAGCFTG